jgi:putative flippase GtrA
MLDAQGASTGPSTPPSRRRPAPFRPTLTSAHEAVPVSGPAADVVLPLGGNGPPIDELLAPLDPAVGWGEPGLRRRATAGRVFWFGVVGASGIAVNTAALWLLADPAALGLQYLLAAVLATQVSTTWNFLLIDRLVYRGAKARSATVRYLAFSGANNLLLLLRVPMLALLVTGVGMHYLAANLLTLLVTFVARFLASDRFIFQKGTAS